jgi:hypothetical protein
MSGKARKETGFGFADFLVILLCLSGAAASFNLFRLDLFQTLDSKNEEPVGIVIVKNNIVQRRMSDRVLWDRLSVASPAYIGDLIRVAEFSDATLIIANSQIDLGENTLIRIQRPQDGEGPIRIELSQGSLGLATGAEEGTITLDLMGRQVQAGPGTALTAAAGESGMALQVREGTAVFVEETRSRELSTGTMIALDLEGTERRDPAVVVTLPRSNARYLKSRPEPLPVAFAWNRINLEPDDPLRLEIALDRNFTQLSRRIENLGAGAETALDAGLWHWRLSFGDTVLSSGRISVADAAGPALLNPAMDRLFRYQEDSPVNLRFEWSETEEASHYILEVSDAQDFADPRIRKQVDAVFLTDSSLGPGTWYWRVMPVFSSVYEGSAAFSSAALFRIEQLDNPEEIVNSPPPEPAPVIPPEIRLVSPAGGTTLAGLTALRQQTVFRWDLTGEAAKSRFVLSRNPKPFQGRPEVEILNPDRTINLARLGEGVWYWTVEAEDPEGVAVAAEPLRLEVLPIPLLPAPGNRLPAEGHRIGLEELQARRNIVFRWSAVQGANGYILTLYQQTASGRRQIIQRSAENRTSWTLEDLSVLDSGTFVWQVEAVNMGRNDAIEQQGRAGENTFVMDIPLPGQVRIEDTGTLYGN